MERTALITTVLWPFWVICMAYIFTLISTRKRECPWNATYLIFLFFTLWPVALFGPFLRITEGLYGMLMWYSVNLVAPFFKLFGLHLLPAYGHSMTILEEAIAISVGGLGHLLPANLFAFLIIKLSRPCKKDSENACSTASSGSFRKLLK